MENDEVRSPPGRPSDERWERTVLEKLVASAAQEQRRARRWNILFKSLGFVYLFLLLFLAIGWFGDRQPSTAARHTAMVSVRGVLESEGEAAAEKIIEGLKDAFKDTRTQGVVLRINSPGGSPVQAGYINDEVRRLKKDHPKIPVYAVVEDICASGGYYVAVAADRIFVDKASLIGSVGVLMDGFGFTGTMEKLGVERRLLAAGENKGFLDPFSPLSDSQRQYAQRMLNEIHQQFIRVVREGRGDRLKETPDIFSGLVWTGEKSLELGLADAYGSVDYVAREIVKAEAVVDFTPKEHLFEKFARRVGSSAARTLASIVMGESVRLR